MLTIIRVFLLAAFAVLAANTVQAQCTTPFFNPLKTNLNGTKGGLDCSPGGAGSVGPTGATGPSGAAGATGTAGTNGTNGSAGAAGATGATGPAGSTGAVGATGATGPAPSGTGIVAVTSGTPGLATAANIVSVFSTCSGTQYLGADGTCHNAVTVNQNLRDITFSFDGGGVAITSPATRCREVSFAGTIQGAYIESDVSGNIVFDVLTLAHSSYTGMASVVTSITASAKPTLSSAAGYTDETLTGWTTALTAKSSVCAAISGAGTLTWATLTLKVAAN
jgi:hypothetical protein